MKHTAEYEPQDQLEERLQSGHDCMFGNSVAWLRRQSIYLFLESQKEAAAFAILPESVK